MNAEVSLKFNNNYHIELIDSITGDVKQKGDFHNVVLNGAKALLVGKAVGTGETHVTTSTAAFTYTTFCYKMTVGSGTTEPTQSDTKLTTPLWSVKYSTLDWEWIDDYSVRITAMYSFPATSAYVGTVSEIGLACRLLSYRDDKTGPYVTHALLTDSEGNIIQFNKTDLDLLKITVVVEISLGNTANNFKLFKKCNLLRHMAAYTSGTELYGGYRVQAGKFNLCRYKYDLQIAKTITSGNLDKVLGNYEDFGYYVCNNDTGTYLRISNFRMAATDVTSETYYKAIAFPGLGYFELPNEDIFPAYDIKGINIGVGDGVATQFENPLCYFKKDSEVIYRNGNILTRGVDYTINHMGNKLCLPEVTDMLWPIKVHSDVAYVTTLAHAAPIIPSLRAADADSPFSLSFSNAHPLYIEYEDEVTLNCLKSTGGWRTLNGTNGYGRIPYTHYIYVDASTDGVAYEQVASVYVPGERGGADTAFSVDFEDTTAKYWRLRTSYTSYPIAIEPGYYLTLNRKDPYIIFTEAPAEGDVITMDVKMDVLMKNGNFVFDMSAKVDFAM